MKVRIRMAAGVWGDGERQSVHWDASVHYLLN